MSKVNDGGPFHPIPGEIRISLRDWFAGMAMQGLISNSDLVVANYDLSKERSKHPSEGLAMVAYVVADAMIEARGK